MKLRPQSIQILQSQFYNTDLASYDDNSTLAITTYIYNVGDFKAGRPAVASLAWTYVPVAGNQILAGLFKLSIPASALGPGPNSPGNVFPLTIQTIGVSALDGVTIRFTDTVQAFSKASTS